MASNKEFFEDLASLKQQIDEGKVVPPVHIVIKRGEKRLSLTLEKSGDIFIPDEKNGNAFAKIRDYTVKAGEFPDLKVGKDAAGKPVFLKNL